MFLRAASHHRWNKANIKCAGKAAWLQLFILQVISTDLLYSAKRVIPREDRKHWTKKIWVDPVSIKDFSAGDLAVAFIITTTNRCCYRNYTVNKLMEQGRGRKMMKLEGKKKRKKKKLQCLVLVNESPALKPYLSLLVFPLILHG